VHYVGGKFNSARHITEQIAAHRAGRVYLEPFVGGGHILERVPHDAGREAGDANVALVTLYKAVQEGWPPPAELSKDEHRRLGALNDPTNPLTAFAGIGCSFMGMWFATWYAAGAGVARRALIRQKGAFEGVNFRAQGYADWDPRDRMIYCDPPYAGTMGYMTGAFDHGEFWRTLQAWAEPVRGNTVLVSEYVCPPGVAEKVAEWEVRGKLKSGGRAVERLFQVKP